MKKIIALVAFAWMSLSMYAANITVAQALEIGKQLEAGTESAEEYTIEGYVAKQFGVYQEGVQSFYMTDDANPSSSGNYELQAYQCKVPKGVPVGSKVTVTGKILNSNRTLTIRVKGGTVTIISEGTGEKPGTTPTTPPTPTPTENTITVAEAIAIAQALAEGEYTSEEYVVAGYAVKVYDKNSDGSWSFYMADEAGARGDFMASNCPADKDVQTNDFMLVKGKITKYKAKSSGNIILQIYKGTATHGTPSQGGGGETPTTPTLDAISVAEAVAIAQALAEGEYTSTEYIVGGFAVKVYDKNSDGSWSYYMADEAGAKGDFMASNCSADKDVQKNDFMLVKGKITKYKAKSSGNIILQIYKGTATHGTAPQGLDEVVLTEKAQKIMLDGVVYIVRDGKLFNLQGAQVR